jgi:putative phosphoesterase
VRIGILADVHCHHVALAAAIEELERDGVDEILLAGDAHYEYRLSNEVAELMRTHGVRAVQGNHEAMLLGAHGARALASPTVRAANRQYVQDTPTSLRVQVDGRSLLMLHASPWPPYNQYLYPDDPLWQRCAELDADYLVLGHTHVPMTERIGRTLVLNPGSLAYSRAPGPVEDITYLVLDTSDDEVTLVQRPRMTAR